MSEQRFKDAKTHLAFSQQLKDKMVPPQMAQPQPQTGAAQPEQTPMAQPAQEQQTPQNDPMQEIVPRLDRIEKLLEADKDIPQEAVLKIEGTMEPQK